MNDSQSTEKDRSTLAKESAAALPTNPSEKESVMTNITDYTTIDLVAEAERRGLPIPATLREQPPAGFTIGFEDDMDGQEFMYCTGPKASSGNITVETFWSIPGGVEYNITNARHADNGIFNEKELIELARLIREVMAATKTTTAQNSGIKVCATCNEGKPLDQYSKHISNRDGLQSHCKDCAAEYYAKGGSNA
ncbi:hypothetical protein [Glutamicibacter creatinolyticus]|uniref:hypothetical protein n=1 Tax=Glutamicibacter creatinolyticus TaxID=162496 RepID=UPI0032165E17